MFLKPSILKKLMKQAYKTGLYVKRYGGWIMLGGSYWEALIKEEFIPKQTKGDLIALVGELPEEGECYSASSEGNQMELEYVREDIHPELFKAGILEITRVMLISQGGALLRVLQDGIDGTIYPISETMVEIIHREGMDIENGESELQKIQYRKGYGVLFQNNVCRFVARFQEDEYCKKIMEEIEGMDLMPEV